MSSRKLLSQGNWVTRSKIAVEAAAHGLWGRKSLCFCISCFPFPVWEMEQERHPEDPMTSARNTRRSHRASLPRVKFISCFPVFLRTSRFSLQCVSHCLDLDRFLSYLCILSEQIQNRTCLLSSPGLHRANAGLPIQCELHRRLAWSARFSVLRACRLLIPPLKAPFYRHPRPWWFVLSSSWIASPASLLLCPTQGIP